jgi:cysteine desulfuration protein SufE
MPTDQQTIIQLSNQFTLTDIEVVKIFTPLKSWEDKFRQLMLLGKKLPQLPIEYQLEQDLVSGC